MKKVFFGLLGLAVFCGPVIAAEDPLSGASKSLKDQIFIVDSDENSESESLNRISGEYDLGFSSSEQSFESTDHYRPGPFGRADAYDTSQSY